MARASIVVAVVALAAWLVAPARAMETVTIPALEGTPSLSAYWFPAKLPGPRPAVISLHGCNGLSNSRGGLSGSYVREADYFNVEGMHVIVPDSLTPRGYKSICEIPHRDRTIREEDRRGDVFAVMRWLAARADVDRERIVVIGRSHGGQTLLSVLDRTDSAVKAQPIKPRAGVALYPGCVRFNEMWNYEISAPLLLMIGERDDWTRAENCRQLHDKVRRAQADAPFELIVYPGAHHAFDSLGPVVRRENVPNRAGFASVGGNPEARERAHARTFDFIAAQLGVTLRLSHQERLKAHRYRIPRATNFARADEISRVPLRERGRERYRHYLSLNAPKAFVITERGGWYFSHLEPQAMRLALENCERVSQKCWLYAVDHRVVWSDLVETRIGLRQLRPVRQ